MKTFIGSQSFFNMRGRPITKRDAIEYIQDNRPIFTLASSEKDNTSKELCTDGVDIWKE